MLYHLRYLSDFVVLDKDQSPVKSPAAKNQSKDKFPNTIAM